MAPLVSEQLTVPLAPGNGPSIIVNPRSPISVSLGGTFVATIKFQYSPRAAGDVWFDIDSPLTGTGLQTLRVAEAKRVRAVTVAYTSGNPVATVFHDRALNSSNAERMFTEEDMAVPTTAGQAGAPIALSDGEQATIHVYGTFVGSLQVQTSIQDFGDVWHDFGAPITAPQQVRVQRQRAARVRIRVVSLTTGQALATILHGLSHEEDTMSVGDHVTTHESGGIDELNVGGLSGLLADPQTPTAHATQHENGGSDELDVTGLSGMLADPQTPDVHALSHEQGGSDPMVAQNLSSGLAAAGQTIVSDGAGGWTLTPLAAVTAPVLLWGDANISALADTRFITPGRGTGTSDTSETAAIPLPRGGTIRRLFVRHNSSAGNGNNVVYAIVVNGTPTALTVTLATGAVGQTSDLVNTVAVNQGDRVSLQAVKSSGIGSGAINVEASVEFV